MIAGQDGDLRGETHFPHSINGSLTFLDLSATKQPFSVQRVYWDKSAARCAVGSMPP